MGCEVRKDPGEGGQTNKCRYNGRKATKVRKVKRKKKKAGAPFCNNSQSHIQAGGRRLTSRSRHKRVERTLVNEQASKGGMWACGNLSAGTRTPLAQPPYSSDGQNVIPHVTLQDGEGRGPFYSYSYWLPDVLLFPSLHPFTPSHLHTFTQLCRPSDPFLGCLTAL